MNITPKFSGAALTDDRSILDALRGSELVRKAAAERDSHVTAFRKTAAQKLAQLEASAEVSFPGLRAAREATIAAARIPKSTGARRAMRLNRRNASFRRLATFSRPSSKSWKRS